MSGAAQEAPDAPAGSAHDPQTGVEPATLFSNSAWMLMSQGVGLVLGSALSVYAVRQLSVESWGHYSTALAVIAIATVFSESGISSLTLREMTATESRRSEILGTALSAVALTAVGALILLVPITLALGYPSSVVVLVAVGAPAILLQPAAGVMQAGFNAARVLRYAAQFNIARTLATVAVSVALVAAGVGPAALLIGVCAGNLAASASGLALLRSRLGLRPSFAGARERVAPYLRAAVPIAGIGMITIIYDRLDVIMLSKLAEPTDVAHYAVPYTLITLSWMVPSVVASAFFPLLRTLLRERPGEARDAFFLVVRLFFFISLPISLFLAVGGYDFLPFAFGERYRASAGVLAIMAWTSVLGFQNYVFWYGLLARHKERTVLAIQITGLAINAATNAILIPSHGPRGAAVALLVSDFWVVAWQVVLVHRRLFAIPFRSVALKPLLAAAIAVPLALLIARTSHALAAVAGGLAYGLILLATAYITREEWRPLTDPVGAFVRRLRPA